MRCLRTTSRSLLVVIFLAAALGANAAQPHTVGAPGPICFIPQWTPQAQFAGYYVAFEKGFYAARGLDVKILEGGPARPSAEWLQKGAAEFATMFLSTAIVERAKGIRLVNIGQIVARSSQVLIAKKSSGIKSFRDMNGKKVGLWGGELSILPRALFEKYGLHVVAVPQSWSVDLFLRGGVDVASAMMYNEYHAILQAGVDPDELTVFSLGGLGFNVPEDGIYCMESTFEKDPQTCRRFVQASIQGWRYAFEHPAEALGIVMKYVNEARIATNGQHQEWMLDDIRKAIDLPPPGGSPAAVKKSDYMAIGGELMTNAIIHRIPAYSNLFKNCAAVHEK
ncbi:MAG: ABC transporter substrate-binding protein [Syntrophobacteraceae bacterium]|nr:ABC transporter substrate-binding protein [Syntrophobacteraceae bacterium]